MVALGIVFVLQNQGVEVASLLAGLGIGGLALAMAAKDTLANLFGSIMILVDRPFHVGEWITFDGGDGVVEEIGLRSTRVRTLDRTVITIPNGEFSNLALENFAKRDRMRLWTMIGVRYETTPEQIRYVLARLRELLLGHPMVSPDPARVRFIGYGAFSLDVEIFAYIRSIDNNIFLGVQEDLLLRILDIVNESGTGFAFPSQVNYLSRDRGLDADQRTSREQEVEQWRQRDKLPFPEFEEEQEDALRDTLDYPPRGSSQRTRND